MVLRSRNVVVAGAFVVSLSSRAIAQSRDTTTRPVPLSSVTVTATRTERTTFNTPQPITVLDSAALRETLFHGVADHFRDQTGLDASGVGPNQRRPEIRGLRGQRILLLQDGLRLNNARRQQDFGELPALAGISPLERVEVVRGPSSVLYGTDAIGGVVNLFSGGLPRSLPSGAVRGEMSFRYGDAGSARTPSGTVVARVGRASFRATAGYREAGDYRAPAGSFGNITLDEDVIVQDSRVRDRSYRLFGGYELTATSELFARAELYSAEHAGFGFVDPALLGPAQPTIRIRYPDQDYFRYTLGYRAGALATPFANRVEVSAYTQENERHLAMNIFVPISPTANVRTDAYNFTDVETVGGRVELAKSVGAHVLTYGVDAFRDRSDNTDSSMTVVTGFGPPSSRSSNVPTVPNATFRSAGAFAQLELNPADRFTTTLGARLQDVEAETKATSGVTSPLVKSNDRAVAWAANALYRVISDLNAVASVGRGFRAPNLVERFFEGEAPEGGGFQRRNPDLDPETSLNVDLGLRYRRGPWYAESFVFRNDIKDAIAAVETGELRSGRPVFQSRNVGRLRIDGLEVTAGARSSLGIDASLGFTRLIGSNISDPDSPIGDTYSNKIVGDLGYRPPGGRFAIGYTVRRQGEQKDVIIGNNPIGDVIPSFVVHSARATVRLFDRPGLTQHLLLSIENIGDKLYAEFPNASFFRPEPGRTVSLGLVVAF